jgi:hypothetical protein
MWDIVLPMPFPILATIVTAIGAAAIFIATLRIGRPAVRKAG